MDLDFNMDLSRLSNKHTKILDRVLTCDRGTLVPYDTDILVTHLTNSKEFLEKYDYHIEVIDRLSCSDRVKKMKKKVLVMRLRDIYLTLFIKNRVTNKNNIQKEIENWNKENILPTNLSPTEKFIYSYKNFKNFRKFPTKQGYDYYSKYNKEPWIITNIAPHIT